MEDHERDYIFEALEIMLGDSDTEIEVNHLFAMHLMTLSMVSEMSKAQALTSGVLTAMTTRLGEEKSNDLTKISLVKLGFVDTFVSPLKEEKDV